MITYISLFSGVGAFEVAMNHVGLPYELIGFSEIDPYAIKTYCAITGTHPSKNLGDIRDIDIAQLPKVDLITHGSPCQDLAHVGLRSGATRGSGTRSALLWNAVDIIQHCNPSVVIWENVKSVLYKNMRVHFDAYLAEMQSLGYVNHWRVLNSKDFGIPHNRERVFVVSVKNGVGLNFNFDTVCSRGSIRENVLDFEQVTIRNKR